MPPTRAPRPTVGVVIPAGGTARRLGGVDKPALDVGGRSILDHVLDGVAGLRTVVVGPRPDQSRPDQSRHDASAHGGPGSHVRWCLEDPPLGGPAAALAAGVAALEAWFDEDDASTPGTSPDVVVVLAGDQPFAARAVARLLTRLAEDPAAEVAAGLDADGRAQPLVAAYRLDALRPRLVGGLAGASLRSVVGGLRSVEVLLTSDEEIDVDDPADLERARAVRLPAPAPAGDPAPRRRPGR